MLKDINGLERIIIKSAMICAIVYALSPDSAHAITANGGNIQGLDTIWAIVKPYFTWAFSLGGVSYCGLNLRKVLIGDYRAAAPAALAALVAGVGVNGLFSDTALSVLLP
ncbi:MAG: hypothetical protein FADNKDHG_01499 [Holosporales bacterium]